MAEVSLALCEKLGSRWKSKSPEARNIPLPTRPHLSRTDPEMALLRLQDGDRDGVRGV